MFLQNIRHDIDVHHEKTDHSGDPVGGVASARSGPGNAGLRQNRGICHLSCPVSPFAASLFNGGGLDDIWDIWDKNRI
jgi:hypothetical protein